MRKARALGAVSGLAMGLALALPAGAQETGAGLDDAPDASGRVIVVTGSLIAGSREDAPAPVEVIEAEELGAQGNPSMLVGSSLKLR